MTKHLRRKLEESGAKEITRRCLTLVPTQTGEAFYRDEAGDCWRTFVFIERVKSYEAVESPKQALEAARAFGLFQSLLVDLPGNRLVDTIPDFHNARKRFSALQAAVANDSLNAESSFT